MRKKFSPAGVLTWDLQIHSLALNQLSYGDIAIIVFESYLLISKITPQTLDQYWSHLLNLTVDEALG